MADCYIVYLKGIRYLKQNRRWEQYIYPNNADNEIARIVEEVITEHLQNYSENEEPHEHSGP